MKKKGEETNGYKKKSGERELDEKRKWARERSRWGGVGGECEKRDRAAEEWEAIDEGRREKALMGEEE